MLHWYILIWYCKVEHFHLAGLCNRVKAYDWRISLFVVWIFTSYSILWRRHHYRWGASNFDLYLAFMAIEQWDIFNVPHLLRHGISVCNNHLRGPVSNTNIAERLASGTITTFFYILGIRTPNFLPCDANNLTILATIMLKNWWISATKKYSFNVWCLLFIPRIPVL